MSSTAPRGFRRTVVLRRSLPGRSSRDPGLTTCPPNRDKSVVPSSERQPEQRPGPSHPAEESEAASAKPRAVVGLRETNDRC